MTHSLDVMKNVSIEILIGIDIKLRVNFTSNLRISYAAPEPPIKPSDPCVPSPCGAFATCRNIGGVPACSCSNNYVGSPPNCRPECLVHSECTSNYACITEKCRDPCPGSCGLAAKCTVVNHVPVCTCPEGYTGDPFTNCSPQPPQSKVLFTFLCNDFFYFKKMLNTYFNKNVIL